MEREEEKKGFTIRDRRTSAQPSGAEKEEPKRGPGPAPGEFQKRESPEQGKESEIPLPEVTFSSFILSLSTSALMHLGEVPDPVTKKIDKSLALAKQSIDMLGMLKEKTKGNLSADEEKLMDHLLADLRWRYVRESKS